MLFSMHTMGCKEVTPKSFSIMFISREEVKGGRHSEWSVIEGVTIFPLSGVWLCEFSFDKSSSCNFLFCVFSLHHSSWWKIWKAILDR